MVHGEGELEVKNCRIGRSPSVFSQSYYSWFPAGVRSAGGSCESGVCQTGELPSLGSKEPGTPALPFPNGESKAGPTYPNVTARCASKTAPQLFVALIQAPSRTPGWGGSTAVVICRNSSLLNRYFMGVEECTGVSRMAAGIPCPLPFGG